jgi:hypothetical protein
MVKKLSRGVNNCKESHLPRMPVVSHARLDRYLLMPDAADSYYKSGKRGEGFLPAMAIETSGYSVYEKASDAEINIKVIANFSLGERKSVEIIPRKAQARGRREHHPA